MYCGKIVIPKFKNEDSYLAQALHEPIITETLFLMYRIFSMGEERNMEFQLSRQMKED
jgi:site-specific DNA recombinase